MSYSEQLEKLLLKASLQIDELVTNKGTESTRICFDTLKIKDDEFNFNSEDGRWFVEVTNDALVDNRGQIYSFSTLPTEEFLQLVDYLIQEYN